MINQNIIKSFKSRICEKLNQLIDDFVIRDNNNKSSMQKKVKNILNEKSIFDEIFVSFVEKEIKEKDLV